MPTSPEKNDRFVRPPRGYHLAAYVYNVRVYQNAERRKRNSIPQEPG